MIVITSVKTYQKLKSRFRQHEIAHQDRTGKIIVPNYRR